VNYDRGWQPESCMAPKPMWCMYIYGLFYGIYFYVICFYETYWYGTSIKLKKSKLLAGLICILKDNY
jgi:hypothetical protein